jgi:monoterpene epsilon-lactone hydrolase
MLDSGTPSRQVTVVGDSAGGGLAMSLMVTLQQEKLPLPGGSVLMCPGIDLTFEELDEVPRVIDEPQPAMSLEQLRSFAESYIGGHPIDDPVLSPLKADLTGLPPMLIQGGTSDVIVVDAHRLAEHAGRCGVDVRLELYPVPTHDFHIFWSFLPEAADALQQAGGFIREVRDRQAAAG